MRIIKTTMKIIISVMLLTMTLLTALIFFYSNADKRFFFAGGSTESLMKLVVANVYLQAFFLLICGFLWYKLLRSFNVKTLLLFICVFSLWLMSGRTIGVFSDGRVKLGWFYFETDEFDICADNRTDCETIANYQTTVEGKFLWRVQIKNRQVNHGIFIGPVIWYRALKMVKSEFGAGAYTK